MIAQGKPLLAFGCYGPPAALAAGISGRRRPMIDLYLKAGSEPELTSALMAAGFR